MPTFPSQPTQPPAAQPAAGSAARTGTRGALSEEMHAALSRVVKSHMDSTVTQMEQVCQRNMAAAQTEMLKTMSEFFDPAIRRLDGHDTDIQQLRQEQHRMAQENERLKKSVDEIK
eukprot:207632-Pyramimonas_sp.AAC.1